MNAQDHETAHDAALALGREMRDATGLMAHYMDVQDDALEDGHASLRIRVGLVTDKMAAWLAETGYSLEYLGPDPEKEYRAVFTVRTSGDVHEGVY